VVAAIKEATEAGFLVTDMKSSRQKHCSRHHVLFYH